MAIQLEGFDRAKKGESVHHGRIDVSNNDVGVVQVQSRKAFVFREERDCRESMMAEKIREKVDGGLVIVEEGNEWRNRCHNQAAGRVDAETEMRGHTSWWMMGHFPVRHFVWVTSFDATFTWNPPYHNSVHMLWHDDEIVQFHFRTNRMRLEPLIRTIFLDVVQSHFSINNGAKRGWAVAQASG